MALRLGDLAPDFTADTTHGTIQFHTWKGNAWAVLFSHPRDFTPVCTTELGTVAGLKAQFEQRNTKVIGLSVDPLESHRRWESDIHDVTGNAVNFPMIADPDGTIAMLYDMIHPNASETATVRSVFIIGPDHKVKLTLTYPASTGRNFQELLRVLDSLQLTARTRLPQPPIQCPENFAEKSVIPLRDELNHRFGLNIVFPAFSDTIHSWCATAGIGPRPLQR